MRDIGSKFVYFFWLREKSSINLICEIGKSSARITVLKSKRENQTSNSFVQLTGHLTESKSVAALDSVQQLQ